MQKTHQSLVRRMAMFLLLPLMALFSNVALALIEIEITKGGDSAIPIAIVPFGWQGSGAAPEDFAAIVSEDLQRSGFFAPMNRNDLIANPVMGDTPRFANWRISGVDYLLVGGVEPADGGYKVQFQLFDVIQQDQMTAYTFNVKNQSLRSAAHQIADEVFEEILGIPGAFNTQIAFVSVEGRGKNKQFQLQLADADGRNPQAMLTSERPIISPSWAPDGIRIAYVSFENKRQSAIYVQDREKGSRVKVISQQGINGAPSWAPDGQRLAVVLSHEGNPEVYVVDIGSGQSRRVTNNEAIDTEPVWLDNDTLIFTSDRSGGPQLYEVPSRGGKAKRLTYDGNYNASATISPDGTTVAFVHGANGRYQIAAIDRNSSLFQILTSGSLDESPTFAPNGQMIMFATENGGQGTLGAVSIDGSVVQSLSLDSGTVREPAWSPYTK